jgi:hypothetical protein
LETQGTLGVPVCVGVEVGVPVAVMEAVGVGEACGELVEPAVALGDDAGVVVAEPIGVRVAVGDAKSGPAGVFLPQANGQQQAEVKTKTAIVFFMGTPGTGKCQAVFITTSFQGGKSRAMRWV